MAEQMGMPGGEAAQEQRPKDAVNYRQGGDVCHVCANYRPGGEGAEAGTCTKVSGAINGHDVCDVFLRAGHAAEEEREVAPADTDIMADSLQRRGLISDKAMAGMRGRGY